MSLRVFEHRETLPRGDGEICGEKESAEITARLQKQADAVLTMEEEEEVHFKRPDTVPDTPRVSRTNSPDREEGEAKDYTAVLEMVRTVRDRFGLPATIYAGSAIAKVWRSATCRGW